MTEAQKDTIYVDVDEDITGIIDKVQNSKHKIVALVLPKRAAVLQSVVNMKLLKRTATTSKKNLVLITSEASLMPLAGAVGLHVAKNLQSKPAIPTGPDKTDIPESLVEEDEIEAPEPDVDANKSVGELAGAESKTMPPEDEEIEVDNTAAPAAAAKAAKGKKAPKGKDKNLKVPNFERFRKWFIIGGIALVALFVLGYFAFFQWPKAVITIDAASTDKVMNLTFTADTAGQQFNEANNTIPAKRQEVKKTDTQTTPATGQKNNGAKASGSVTMSIRQCNGIATPQPVAAGTGLSVSGQTYITQGAANFAFDSIQNNCIIFKSGTVQITAQNGGANYNVNNASFAVSGRSEATATGSASGGTDQIVKVVTQGDVDTAKGKMNTSSNEQAARNELNDALKKANFTPVPETFATKGPDITTSPNVGDQADNVTVTATTTYSMVGINQDDLSTLVTNQADKTIDTNNQSVINDGLDQASYSVQDNGANPKINVQTTVAIGPKIDQDALKKEIAGKKKGETIKIVQDRPGIQDVNVSYSPFYVFSTPKNTNKITIVFNKAN